MYLTTLKSETLASRYCSRAPVRLGRRYSPSVMCAACCKKAESLVPTMQVSITTPCLCTCTTVKITKETKDSDNDDAVISDSGKNKTRNRTR